MTNFINPPQTVKNGGLTPCWDVSDGWLLADRGGHPFLNTQAYHKVAVGRDIPLGTFHSAKQYLNNLTLWIRWRDGG